MTLSGVARRADMTRAAARRYLLTLCELGYVTGDGKYFRLTPRVLALGFAFLTSMHIWERAQPFMEQLTEQVNESCSISVLDRSEEHPSELQSLMRNPYAVFSLHNK